MEFVENNSIKSLINRAKENHQFVDSVKSVQLVNQNEIVNIVEKCTENMQHIRDLLMEHLQTHEVKSRGLSSPFTITSSDKTSYTIFTRQKAISLEEIDLLHQVFTKVESIELYMFNLRYNQDDRTIFSKVANRISSVIMTFNTFPVNMSRLIAYIFNSFGENLRYFELNKGGSISSKDHKWDLPSEEIINDGKQLLQRKYYLPKLESVQISHFYQKFPMEEFTKCLSKSACVLKHASFIGVAKSEPIISHLKSMAQNSLRSLALDTYQFPNLQNFREFALDSLSLRWGDSSVIDIVSALTTLPNLKKLNLGYDVDYGYLEKTNKAGSLNTTSSLESLTLHHVFINEDTMEHFSQYMPKLVELKLSSCKFGSSRVSTEETISLQNYYLQQLVLENCSLYSNKKDSSDKRLINKLNITLDSTCSYTGSITSKNRSFAKYENLSNVGNEFSYCCFSESKSRPTNTLYIKLKSIKAIKLDDMGLKAVGFHVANTIEPKGKPAAAQASNSYEYSDLYESFMKEEIDEKATLIIPKITAEIEDIAVEKIEQQQKSGEDDSEAIIIEKTIKTEETIEEQQQGFSKNKDRDEDNLPLTAADIKRLKKLQENDKDFVTASETEESPSTSSDSEKEGLPIRRSTRNRYASTYREKRPKRNYKRVKYDFDTSNSNEESTEETGTSDSDADYRMTEADRKRTSAFIERTRGLKPVINVYRSKVNPDYYH